MYFTDRQLVERQKQSIHKIKLLINQNLLSLDDISAILPGYVHLNNKVDFSLSYLCVSGRRLTGYTQEELNTYGFDIIVKHQSHNYLKKVLPRVESHFKNSQYIGPISYMQDWRMDTSKENYSLFVSSKIVFDEENYLTVSQGVETLEKLSSSFLESFTDSRTYQEYFDSYYSLTKRELQVLSLLALGSTRKNISDQLFISTGTVKKHCENIYKKLGTSDRLVLLKIHNAFS